MNENIWNNENLKKTLEGNGVAVMPTDTIYGMVGRAQSEDAVDHIYSIRGRSSDKPCIILIGDINELEKFSIILSDKQKKVLEEYWFFNSTQNFQPGPTSVVLDCKKYLQNDPLLYLHRGTGTLAFRMPAPQALRELLLKTGPLIAPSANPEALPPCGNIADAKKYFGNSVDLYIDGGEIRGKASKVVKLHKDGSISILRE